MSGSDWRDLTGAEQSFLAQVTYQLRREPRDVQRAVLLAAQRAVSARPPVHAFARLERALGTPADFTRTLLNSG